MASGGQKERSKSKSPGSKKSRKKISSVSPLEEPSEPTVARSLAIEVHQPEVEQPEVEQHEASRSRYKKTESPSKFCKVLSVFRKAGSGGSKDSSPEKSPGYGHKGASPEEGGHRRRRSDVSSSDSLQISPSDPAQMKKSPGKLSDSGDSHDEGEGKKRSVFSKIFKPGSGSKKTSPESILSPSKRTKTSGSGTSIKPPDFSLSDLPKQEAATIAALSLAIPSGQYVGKGSPTEKPLYSLGASVGWQAFDAIIEAEEVSSRESVQDVGKAKPEDKKKHILSPLKLKSKWSKSPVKPPKGSPKASRTSPKPYESQAKPLRSKDYSSPPYAQSGPSRQDLSAIDPFINPNIPENMVDTSDYARPRSASGSTTLKSILSSKSKSRNKSVEREEKKEKDKDKKRGFFEQFRPRSKSDVSGLKRPSKKSSLPTEHSMDESTLMAQTNYKSFGGSQETITPMGQILEGQMLNVPEEDRIRHKSGPSGYREGGFMMKMRTRSNSETKPPKSPKRTLQSQKSLSPPPSPRADRSGLSPLKLQSGEPRSAPPGLHRGSVFADHTHAVTYKADVHKPSVEPDRMDIEDLDENKDQAYARFMKVHKCYDLIPTSAKLVIFDTQLNVKKAFFALIYNDVRAAPLWDSAKQNYVGMLTITDFIYILKRFYKAPDVRMDELEDQKIENWRGAADQILADLAMKGATQYAGSKHLFEMLCKRKRAYYYHDLTEMVKETTRPFQCIGPDASLYDAVMSLSTNHVHRLPIVDDVTGNAIYILTHKRILRFLHLYMKNLPLPSFMKSSIEELGIGTFDNVITATPDTKLIQALNLFTDHRISALPVINSSGEVISMYARFDVINLAADKSYNNLEITIEEAIRNRQAGQQTEQVSTCHIHDTLFNVIEKIVKAEVHRLVIVDEENHVKGIISLSDILRYIVLRPMETQPEASAAEQLPPADQPPLSEESTIAEEAPVLEPELMTTETPQGTS